MPVLPIVGDQFAGYRLRAVVGRGGMSVVYHGRDPRLGSVVTLKVLAPRSPPTTFPRAVPGGITHRRLAEPPERHSRLRHGAERRPLYIAMRYITGTDLRTLLESTPRSRPVTPSS